MCVLLMLAQVLVVLHAKPGFFWTLLINSCMAYAVNLTNFLVTKYTSALTLQVLGNMKGVIAAGISIAMFKNPVTAKGMIGYAITVGGVLAYSEVRPAGAWQADVWQAYVWLSRMVHHTESHQQQLKSTCDSCTAAAGQCHPQSTTLTFNPTAVFVPLS
jgi:hypothetical protein